jgi:hypothetical protein
MIPIFLLFWKIRESIRALFPDRECFTLVRPVNNEKDLQRLDQLPVSISSFFGITVKSLLLWLCPLKRKSTLYLFVDSRFVISDWIVSI